MAVISCETKLIVSLSANCVISNAMVNQATKFAITDPKIYVSIVTLQLKSGFKRTINWKKYQSEVTIQAQNRYLDYLIDPSLQVVNRLFVLSSSDTTSTTGNRRYFLPIVQIEDYKVVIDAQFFFDHPVKVT